MKNNTNLDENQMDRFAEAATKHNIEKKLKEKYGKILQKNKKNRRGKLININAYVKIAAIVVTVLGCMHLINERYFSPDTQSMAQNFLDQTNISGNPDISRKGTRSAKSLPKVEGSAADSIERQILLEANNAFIAKNYGLAIAKYQILEKQNSLVTIDKFYLGMSFLREGKMPEAIAHFQEIKSKEIIQIEEVDWLLGLAYILSDQKEKALPILEKIKSEKGYKAKEARVLLNNMEKNI